MSGCLRTLQAPCSFAEEIKRSRFFGHAAPIAGEDEVMRLVGEWLDDGATHNAWAFKYGALTRFHDDGEVSGTAGRPILGAIEKAGFDRVVVLVTRFYGGVKLGTGGLVRAYGGCAASCLGQGVVRELRRTLLTRITVPFPALGKVHPLLDRFGAERRGERFDADGAILEISIDLARAEALRVALGDALRVSEPPWEPVAEELL